MLAHGAVPGSSHPAQLTLAELRHCRVCAVLCSAVRWQHLVAHIKHYKSHIFLGPVPILADSLQAHNRPCVLCFVVMLQGLTLLDWTGCGVVHAFSHFSSFLFEAMD